MTILDVLQHCIRGELLLLIPAFVLLGSYLRRQQWQKRRIRTTLFSISLIITCVYVFLMSSITSLQDVYSCFVSTLITSACLTASETTIHEIMIDFFSPNPQK